MPEILTAEQSAARALALRQAAASSARQGLKTHPDDQLLLDAYARGDLTIDEAIAQLVARHRQHGAA